MFAAAIKVMLAAIAYLLLYMIVVGMFCGLIVMLILSKRLRRKAKKPDRIDRHLTSHERAERVTVGWREDDPSLGRVEELSGGRTHERSDKSREAGRNGEANGTASPAPKLGVTGKLNPATASESEKRGESLFLGKAPCVACHQAPYYTDNLMHNLKAERFYKPRVIRGAMAGADGPIKTFPLRGIKESPPYLHDGRLLTLEDTVEFFNLILDTKLTPPEKTDLVDFLRAL